MKCQDNYFKWVPKGPNIEIRSKGKWIQFCDTAKGNSELQHLELDIGDKGGHCLTWDVDDEVNRATVIDFEFLELTQHFWRKGEKKPKTPQFKFACYLK